MSRCFHPSCKGSLAEMNSFQAGFRKSRLSDLFLAAFAVSVILSAPWVSKGADTLTNLTVDVPPSQGTNQPPADGVTNKVNVLDDTYRLAIGDQLSYRVVEDEDDPKILPVTDSGELEVPYLGRYPAAGKTCKQLARELKAALEKRYYWQATVIIAVDSKPKSRGKVYLAGAVGAPGSQDIAGDEVLTVSRAILRAGGLTSFADGKDVKVTRSIANEQGKETNFIVNVSRIIKGGKMEEDVPLMPGDFIYVPERMVRF